MYCRDQFHDLVCANTIQVISTQIFCIATIQEEFQICAVACLVPLNRQPLTALAEHKLDKINISG